MYEPTDDIIVKLKRNNIILQDTLSFEARESIRTDLKNAESLRSEFMATVLMCASYIIKQLLVCTSAFVNGIRSKLYIMYVDTFK